jgi:hypothetical protein
MNPIIIINPLSSLSYLRDDYHKQTVTHIDVHPVGENPINTTRMLLTPV